MNTRKALLGVSFAAMMLCALWLAPASGAKAKFPSTYSGSFSLTSSRESSTMHDIETVEVTGVKLKHYKTQTVRHVTAALYKFTAGQVKWHSETNIDGCAYTLDREVPLASLTTMPPGQPPLFLTRQNSMKPGTYKVGGNFPVTNTEPVTESCTAEDGTSSLRQITPGMPGLSPWTGVKTKLPRIKGHFKVDGSDAGETDHATASWDFVGK